MVEVESAKRAEQIRHGRSPLLSLLAVAVTLIVGLQLLPSQESFPTADSLPTEDSLPNLDTPSVPLAPSKTVAESLMETQAVADSFMEAWVAGDGDVAAAMFNAHGIFSDHRMRFDGMEPGTLSALHDWYRALGWEFRNKGCELVSISQTICAYTFRNDLTRALGRKEVTTSMVIVVVDGGIQRADDQVAFGYRGVDVMFRVWLLGNHPDDLEHMYVGVGASPLLDQASIALWDEYSDEFVASPEKVASYLTEWNEYQAQARGICGAASTAVLDLEWTRDMTEAEYLAWRQAITDLEWTRNFTLEDYAAWSEAAARIWEQALAELRAVPPPDSLLAHVNGALALMGQQTEALRQVVSAATAGDSTLLERLGREGVDRTHAMVELGWAYFWPCPMDLPGLGFFGANRMG
jgi:hypothetical protein